MLNILSMVISMIVIVINIYLFSQYQRIQKYLDEVAMALRKSDETIEINRLKSARDGRFSLITLDDNYRVLYAPHGEIDIVAIPWRYYCYDVYFEPHDNCAMSVMVHNPDIENIKDANGIIIAVFKLPVPDSGELCIQNVRGFSDPAIWSLQDYANYMIW